MAGAGGIELGPESRACRLELDINTVPESTVEIASNKTAELLREFQALASEIAERGDVP